jgi:hypothetical protein
MRMGWRWSLLEGGTSGREEGHPRRPGRSWMVSSGVRAPKVPSHRMLSWETTPPGPTLLHKGDTEAQTCPACRQVVQSSVWTAQVWHTDLR